MLMSKKMFSVFFVFVVVPPLFTLSEPRSPEPRPRIGVALAGGGARGLAHLGVLKWFEEHRIPVDYIAGTSMGGLVGGLFATGRNSAEMIEFVQELDWAEVLATALAYRDLSFRRKEDQRSYPNEVELGWKKGIRFPGGLSAGHKVGLALDRIAFPYSTVKSFDELPTPFRCVAVDLVQMKEIVQKDGTFSRALRATMSIPGVFAPITDDDRLLVDGGLLNNLPTDVVKEMGAQIVIAVDLGAPQLSEPAMQSFFGVLSRSIDVMIQANVRRSLGLATIVLKPELGGYDTFSFDSSQQIIDRGYEAAQRQAGELNALALDPSAWEQYLQDRKRRRRDDQFRPVYLATEGVARQDEPAVADLLKSHLNRPVDLNALGKSLTRIAGWGRYSTAGYSQRDYQQRQGLGIQAQPKNYGPPFIKPSFEINGSEIDDVKFTVAARLTAYDVFAGKSEWRTDLSFGFRDLAAMEFYQPLGRSGFFLAPRALVSRRNQLVFSNEEKIAEYAISDQTVGLDLGYTTGVSHEIRFGYQVGKQRGRTRIGDPSLPLLQGRASSVAARWVFDRLNDPVVPTRGVLAEARGQWFFSSPGAVSGFPQAETRLTVAQPLKPRLSALLVVRGGSTFEKSASPLQHFTLGGPFQLGAVGLQEFRGDHYFYSALGLIKVLSQRTGRFFQRVSITGAYEIGDAFSGRANPYQDGMGGILSETPLGVVFFGGSVGEGGRGKVFFSLGNFF
jgi:NTE family protein